MSDDRKENLTEGTLISHLLELRDRLVKAFISVIVAFVPAAYFRTEIFALLAKPLLAQLPAGSSLIATGVVSSFSTPLKLSFYVAIFVAMPFILTQLWGFVSPGLYKKEKRFAVPLLVSSIVLFYVGVAFAYKFVFPVAFHFFAGSTPEGVKMTPDINVYLDFALTMFLAFGIAFEVPVIVVLLTLTGLVSVEKLSQSRGYVIIGIFVAAAILTPPDVLSQIMMALPMWVLFEAGIIFARILNRSSKSGAEAENAETKAISDLSAAPTPPAARGFLGQPAGFSTLFFTELWERFSYYGMRAILVLFLVGEMTGGGMGLDDTTAYAIYGLYTAGVYIMSMPGGWVADRLLGAQGAVLWGGGTIAMGHLLLAGSGVIHSSSLFLLGLAVIVIGTGLLKPNISSLVGQLHGGSSGGARDAGFTWFYMAINIGATLGPLVTAWLALQFGWHWGFLSAAVGMGAGLVFFLKTRARLGDAGRLPPGATSTSITRDWKIFWIILGCLALLALLLMLGAVRLSPVLLQRYAVLVMALATAAYFAYLFFFAGLIPAEKRGIVVLLVLVAASTLFWAGYEQAGSSLTLFAERNTNRMIGSFEFPSGWFQSVPGVWVLVCAPLLAILWSSMAARGRELSVIVKFALGLGGMGLGFLVMVGAAKVVGQSLLGASGGAGPIWLITTYLLHTLGELCLSPVGMSATTQLAPKRFAGQAMGIWFTSLAMGNLFASQLAGSLDGADAKGMATYFITMFEYGAGGALLLLIAAPWLKRWAAPRP